MKNRKIIMALVAFLVAEVAWLAAGNRLTDLLLSSLLPGHAYRTLSMNLHLMAGVVFFFLCWWICFKLFCRIVGKGEGADRR
jgi:hypothetical protein